MLFEFVEVKVALYGGPQTISPPIIETVGSGEAAAPDVACPTNNKSSIAHDSSVLLLVAVILNLACEVPEGKVTLKLL